uniref:Uncharacterized protein n=1 Tax=candidate division WOR-3 bacterium TaxID=2052148 RepID=A0A7C6EC11_UNCW3
MLKTLFSVGDKENFINGVFKSGKFLVLTLVIECTAPRQTIIMSEIPDILEESTALELFTEKLVDQVLNYCGTRRLYPQDSLSFMYFKYIRPKGRFSGIVRVYGSELPAMARFEKIIMVLRSCPSYKKGYNDARTYLWGYRGGQVKIVEPAFYGLNCCISGCAGFYSIFPENKSLTTALLVPLGFGAFQTLLVHFTMEGSVPYAIKHFLQEQYVSGSAYYRFGYIEGAFDFYEEMECKIFRAWLIPSAVGAIISVIGYFLAR